jgi:quercetin dioxygenase-like cupin family protein
VVAGTKLPSLGDTPLYFRVVSVSISPGQKISLSAPNGILYQLSGSTDVSAGEAKTITGGGGALIAGGTTASLTAGNGEQSALLYFLLAPKEALDQPVAAAPATVKELYRTTAPLPELKPGSYELNLTRVTFPPGMPSNPPHHRSGAALYYIVSGIGANTVDGKTADRGPGSLDLRALRPRPPVGQPRQRAVDLPCFQHQSRRRAGSRPRDACQAIAGERAGWHRPRLGNFRRPRTAQESVPETDDGWLARS